MVLEHNCTPLQKKENLNLFHTPNTVNLRWITNINVIGKTIKLPEENTREYLQDLGVVNFLTGDKSSIHIRKIVVDQTLLKIPIQQKASLRK